MRGYFYIGLFCLIIVAYLSTESYAVQVHGTSDQKPTVESIETLKVFAEMNEPEAQLKLGTAYHEGTGIEKDDARAIFWWQRAGQAKDAEAIRKLTDALLVASLKQRADQGDAWAQLELGINYHEGWGVNQDDKQALALIHQSADQGNAKAQLELSKAYAFGGYPLHQDFKEAAKWCRKAADEGDTESQIQLSWYYFLEAGDQNMTGSMKENMAEAFKWAQKAADHGNVVAEDWLAGFYQKGIGVKQNDQQALILYKKVAAQEGSNSLAQFFINNYNKCGEWRCYPHHHEDGQ